MYLLWNSENPEYVYLSAWKRFLPTCNRESKKIIASKQQRGFDTNQMFQVEWKHCMPRVDKSPRHMEDWKRNFKKNYLHNKPLCIQITLQNLCIHDREKGSCWERLHELYNLLHTGYKHEKVGYTYKKHNHIMWAFKHNLLIK